MALRRLLAIELTTLALTDCFDQSHESDSLLQMVHLTFLNLKPLSILCWRTIYLSPGPRGAIRQRDLCSRAN